MQWTAFCWKKMPPRVFIPGEEKSMPGFKVSRLILIHETEWWLSWSQCLFNVPKILGPLKIMLNLLCLSSINRTTKPGEQDICWQDDLLNILSPLLTLTAQKKKIPFKISLLTDNTPSHPSSLVEIHEIHVVFMTANKTSIFQPTDQGVISTFKSFIF